MKKLPLILMKAVYGDKERIAPVRLNFVLKVFKELRTGNLIIPSNFTILVIHPDDPSYESFTNLYEKPKSI